MMGNGTLVVAGVIIAGVVAYTWLRKQATPPADGDANETPPSSRRNGGKAFSESEKRLFEEHLKTFERDYLAYLLAKEARYRHFPIATLEALAQQYGASKGDPPYTPNLDLPKQGVPSPTVSKLMEAWLAANDDAPTAGLPTFRIQRTIKARLERKVAEICDKAAQTH